MAISSGEFAAFREENTNAHTEIVKELKKANGSIAKNSQGIVAQKVKCETTLANKREGGTNLIAIVSIGIAALMAVVTLITLLKK